MDDDDEQNTRYIAVSNSSLLPDLYTNARVAPVSLTYFGYCLENGNYLVTLHFAEILFTDDNTYRSLGRRIFDIYVQVNQSQLRNTFLPKVHENQTIGAE